MAHRWQPPDKWRTADNFPENGAPLTKFREMAHR
jgi:hypothetical protein